MHPVPEGEPTNDAGRVEPSADVPSDAPVALGRRVKELPSVVPGAAAGRARTWVTAKPMRVPLVVAGLGLVVSAPFGGWRAAESEVAQVPVVEAGEVVEAAPFEVSLERAYFSPRPSESFPELDAGQQYVVVLGTLTSRHDTTVESLLATDAITLVDLPAALDVLGEPVEEEARTPFDLYSAQDSTQLRRIGPDLTYDVGLVYRTAASALPAELTLEVSGYTWRGEGITRDADWDNPAVVAQVVVPLAAQDTSATEGDGS